MARLLVVWASEAFATSASNVWMDASVFEWNPLQPHFYLVETTYFPNAVTGVIPNFTFTKVSGPVTIRLRLNGLLTFVNSILH